MRLPLPSPAALTLGAGLLAAAAGPRLAAQTAIGDYFDHWTDRVEAAQASQPHWITPLATTTPRLEQEFRYDQYRETLNNGSTVNLYDAGKGLELIPTERTELIITLPSYETRGPLKPVSGLNDWPGVLLKYRLLSEPEQSGNYIVTLFAQYGLPTGAGTLTTKNHVVTPTLAAGKGWGDFDLQATLGESIPTSDHSNTGRAVLTNVTAQYHINEYFWPELELNRTDWVSGVRDGRSQTFLTPGLVLGRFLLGGRTKLIVGLGYQTAISRLYTSGSATPTYNHNWILSARVTF
jgi:hypothetical protein